MAVITAIAGSSKREGRFVVVVDGTPAATVSLDIIERLRLAVGVVLTAALQEALAREASALGAYDRALNLLASQPRSRRDLRRRLVQKGESESDVDAAIDRLVAAGYLDDASFARQFARSRVVGKGESRRRLQRELFKRGIDRAVADEAIVDVMSDEQVDEGATVERIARKRLRSLDGLDLPTRRRRLYAFLARRGYDAEVIRRAMSVVLRAGEVPPAEDEAAEDAGAAAGGDER